MEVSKNEFEIISKALDAWEADGSISREQKKIMTAQLHTGKKERQLVAQYFFIIALSCAILAFSAIFIDDKILEKLKIYFELSNVFISVVSFGIAIPWLWYISHIKCKISQSRFEVYSSLGGIMIMIALIYLFKELGAGGYYVNMLFASAAMLLGTAVVTKSRVLWLGALIMLLAWFCSFSSLFSKGYLFLGMNYPVRITVFGAALYGLSFLQRRIRAVDHTARITQVAAAIVFFAGLWMVSIFGNYGHLEQWAQVRQSRVLIFAVVFGLFSAAAVYYGIKQKDDAIRDVGVLTLLLNIYSRYFEYFWDNTNKGLFFLVLAASFYLVGRWLGKYRDKAVHANEG